ncbi:MAG: tRNA dihydrouridine(20/20a) synthase DusA [Rhodoferax sp.]
MLTRHTRLYTEMVTTGALLHGDVARHLDFDPAEHPVALQLGGSEPHDLAQCARLAQRWGYDEINLNCGCPSERVQRGAFGACLMREPALVAQCVQAMVDAVNVPVTVKHRIGLDRDEDYAMVRDFVGSVALAGCSTFIVHARNAWLQGLSPKENRDVPPLRYDVVYRLKQDFPQLTIVLNGGVTDSAQIAQHLQQVDGVMLGRQAYHQPWWMSAWDAVFWDDPTAAPPTRDAVERTMVRYMQRMQSQGVAWPTVAKAMLGLRHGLPGARAWRRVWSDARLKATDPADVMALARGPQADVSQASDTRGPHPTQAP